MDVLTRLDQHIGWLVLNRPSARNAISKAMWDEIPQALSRLQSEGARLILLRGEGGAFAAGADMLELQALENHEQAKAHWLSIRGALNAVARCPLPTVAVIEGPCMGGGCLLAAACDIRLSDEQARFSLPVAQLGIVLDADNIKRLVDICGRAVVAEMLFTAEVLTAQQALDAGLVNRVVGTGELQPAAVDLARRILRNSQAAVMAGKQALIELHSLPGEQDQTPMIDSYLSDEFRSRLAKALTSISGG